jgi:hypothetical protein
MSERFTNNASTTLNGAINNAVTSLVVTSAATFPTAGNFRIRIDDEIMLVTAVSGTTFTVTRAQEGTAAASHSSGATVREVLTAEVIKNAYPWDAIITKASNDTVTSSTTYVNDSELLFSVASGGIYEFEFLPIVQGGGNFKFQATVPASTEGVISLLSINTSGNVQVANAKAASGILGNITSIALTGSNEAYKAFGVFVAGGAGTFRIQFAQGTSNGTGIVLKIGTQLRYKRIL